jgi:DNA-binding transcriptional MerR regulator
MRLSTAQVAERLGISPASVRVYVRRGVFPAPSGGTPRRHYWTSGTVDRWSATRKGRGRPLGVVDKVPRKRREVD